MEGKQHGKLNEMNGNVAAQASLVLMLEAVFCI